ncbi:MAG TPA: hydrogenase expression/formation protein HypE [Candidatus Ratteibacteria bacterium]|nr:hydrogenase expression/formation protein HypE [Candidatus Ratteibacteria bacterium]
MEKITLSYGDGGKLTYNLIENIFVKHFKNEYLEKLQDASLLKIGKEDICFTTDSYTVSPIFFPGGDIGKLSICGTINDLSVSGATPLFLSSSFIIEEGLDFATLEKIVISMANESKKENVKITTGDTKVVEKGKVDKIFINTSGIGIKDKRMKLGIERIKLGDLIIINGDIGLHGISIITKREGIEFESSIKSDCSSLYPIVKEIFQFGEKIKFMRDPTRGGVAATLNEIVIKSNIGIKIYKKKIPISEEVNSLCEILGFDPLYIANEGKIIIIVDRKYGEKVVDVMRKQKSGKKAEIIGEVTDKIKRKVLIETEIGVERVVEFQAGAQFPRIC